MDRARHRGYSTALQGFSRVVIGMPGLDTNGNGVFKYSFPAHNIIFLCILRPSQLLAPFCGDELPMLVPWCLTVWRGSWHTNPIQVIHLLLSFGPEVMKLEHAAKPIESNSHS